MTNNFISPEALERLIEANADASDSWDTPRSEIFIRATALTNTVQPEAVPSEVTEESQND